MVSQFINDFFTLYDTDRYVCHVTDVCNHHHHGSNIHSPWLLAPLAINARATLLNAYVPDTSFYSYTVERDFEGGGGGGGNKQRGRRNNKNNSSSSGCVPPAFLSCRRFFFFFFGVGTRHSDILIAQLPAICCVYDLPQWVLPWRC